MRESLLKRHPVYDQIAFAISAVTSPYVIIPVLTCWIVLRYSSNWRESLLWIVITVLFTTAVPFAYVGLGVTRGNLSDVHVPRREERIVPFIVAIISSFIGTVILHRLGAPREIVALGAVVVANGMVFAALSCVTKVSIHIAVVTVGLFVTGILVSPYVAFGFLGIPLVLWGRIHRHRHSIWEGLTAVPVACAVTYVVFRFFDLLSAG